MRKHICSPISFRSAVALMLGVALSTSALAIAPFQASYQFSYNGKNVGTATRSLAKQGNNWLYKFNAKAGAIASAQESSLFGFNAGKISAIEFKRSSKILVHSNSLNISFSPSSKRVNTQKDDKKRSFAWQPNVLDELNAELQIREDLKGDGIKNNYLLADAKEIENRRFSKQGTEMVKTPFGSFSTIKVVLEHRKPERNTVFWLAPKLDYLPVKVSHNDGGSSYSLLLTKYSAN